MINIVYFSSTSENTKRFVGKLGVPGKRIPLKLSEETLVMDEEYLLIVPTYGGGADTKGAVPKQVIKFLNQEQNRKHIKGVIASGNQNFGNQYCLAGKIISEKCQIPELYNFELLGTDRDVTNVKNIIEKFN